MCDKKGYIVQKFKPNDPSKAKQEQKTKHTQQQRLEENQNSKKCVTNKTIIIILHLIFFW
jgi:hypothetical protein